MNTLSIQKRLLRCGLLAALLGLSTLQASAVEASPVSANPQLEARMMDIATELRCLVCQNQTIADSHAPLAVDLRQQIREMLETGKNERQILDYMTDRYGDFVLYRPPFKTSTLVLWLGPLVLLLLAIGMLLRELRRRQKLDASAFEPETETESPQS
jgi:cytochrome c-type biogenesis protein CcmH